MKPRCLQSNHNLCVASKGRGRLRVNIRVDTTENLKETEHD